VAARRWRSAARGLGGLLVGAALVFASGCKKPDSVAGPEQSSGDDDASITNTQEAGVDEGGIVKAAGEHLVILRRGRLFTVRVAGDRLDPVAVIDVPRSRRRHVATWYDEMLVADGTIVVIGYDYRARATELAIFELDAGGGLRWRDTYYLRSNDYYSSRNYASRRIGDTLVLYTPRHVGREVGPEELPGLLRGGGRRPSGEFAPILDVRDVAPGDGGPVLHTVITCDLGAAQLGCAARGIRGGEGRTFYVSRGAIYVWAARPGREYAPDGVNDAALYRLPLDGGPMSGLRTSGMPVDQFSFHEGRDGQLNVVVRESGVGDWMWGPELGTGPLRLLRLPLAAFDGRLGEAPAKLYRELVRPADREARPVLHNRFVGDHLLYGAGSGGWGRSEPVAPGEGAVMVLPYTQPGAAVERVVLDHGVARIEALGDDALVVGGGAGLSFTTLDLGGARAEAVGHFFLAGVDQGELRSHGFFFRRTGEGDGVLGLPVRPSYEPGAAHLWSGSLGILFLGVDDLGLRRLGGLVADPQAGRHDRCRSSCVDWYGNARPIFLGDRVFALLGYEIVEGDLRGGRIRERRRIDVSTLISGPARERR
jgi:hypothetical protein